MEALQESVSTNQGSVRARRSLNSGKRGGLGGAAYPFPLKFWFWKIEKWDDRSWGIPGMEHLTPGFYYTTPAIRGFYPSGSGMFLSIPAFNSSMDQLC